MRFKSAPVSAGIPQDSGAKPSGFLYPVGRPQWMRDWLENKGRWVVLTCGCKVDLNDQTLLLIRRFRMGKDIGCDQHGWQAIKCVWKSPPENIPDEPMF